MPNVNAPRNVIDFSERHGLDAEPYLQAVKDLQTVTWQGADGSTKRFIDVEIPFAARVLFELESGASMEAAVSAGVHEALEARQ